VYTGTRYSDDRSRGMEEEEGGLGYRRRGIEKRKRVTSG
jgi:hypothetical protein